MDIHEARRPSLRATPSGRKRLEALNAAAMYGASSQSSTPQASPSFRKLFFMYLGDWLLVLALVVLLFLLELIHPYERFVDENFLLYVGYPHRATDTVPNFWLPILGVVFPLAVIALDFLRHRRGAELHLAALALLTAVLLNGVVTDALKVSLGRPRPDFMRRCFFPDNIKRFKDNGNVWCTGDPKTIREGRKSFPSGHTSWSCCGLGFVSLYMAGRLGLFSSSRNSSSPPLMLPVVGAALPLCGALAVGISRIDDYRHHWTDVLAGAVIGLFFATTVYFHYMGPTLLSPPEDSNGESVRMLDEVKGTGHHHMDIESLEPAL